jgi:hypothetical protein
MKVDILDEVKSRIRQGYKGELLYNYRAGVYEITTYKPNSENSDHKLHKIARGQYDPTELIEAVYGKQ